MEADEERYALLLLRKTAWQDGVEMQEAPGRYLERACGRRCPGHLTLLHT